MRVFRLQCLAIVSISFLVQFYLSPFVPYANLYRIINNSQCPNQLLREKASKIFKIDYRLSNFSRLCLQSILLAFSVSSEKSDILKILKITFDLTREVSTVYRVRTDKVMTKIISSASESYFCLKCTTTHFPHLRAYNYFWNHIFRP